jgi:hypothetical protein
MQYLQYQLHVSASTLAIIRLTFNLSRDYTLQKWYMQYLQYQLHVSTSTLAIIRLEFNFNKRLYNLYGVLCGEGVGGGRGTRSRFTTVFSIKIRTLDGITNIWCEYPDSTCLIATVEVCYVSTAFNRMLSDVGVVGRVPCIVRGVCGVGCTSIINLRLRYRWVWSLWVKWVFLVAGVVWLWNTLCGPVQAESSPSVCLLIVKGCQ